MTHGAKGPGWQRGTVGKRYPHQAEQAPPPPVQQSKEPVYKKAGFWLLIAFVSLGGGCAALVAGGGSAVDGTSNGQMTVVYSVTGNGTARLTFDTFANGHSGTAQIANQALPWTRTIVAPGQFNVYSVSATISTGATATCTITVDGKVLSTHTSNSQSPTANCNATST